MLFYILLIKKQKICCRFGKITVSGDGLYKAEEEKPAHFYIDTHGMDGTPEVRVEGKNTTYLCL